MSTICDACQKIFQGGVSPLGLGQAHQWGAGVRDSDIALPFNTKTFPHLLTADSLLASARGGCYICLNLQKFLLSKYSLSELQSLKHDESFTIYEYHGKIDAKSRHPFIFDVLVRCKGSYGVWFNAFPAKGLIHSPELQGLSLNTNSKKSWEQTLEWVEGCTKYHAKCNTIAESSPWFPTRLIDLGFDDLFNIRLIDTRITPPLGQYVTLSYCWGSAATLKLTGETLDAFMTHIPEPELPKTFTDVIKITRRLGVRYLWIDSLCIVQDSVEDWRAESSLMGRVYKNARCNIAATASADSQGGLFFDRDSRLILPAVTMSKWSDCPMSTYQISKLDVWESGVSDAVLNTRGWVFQERILAPRILHFASDQIYWECLELQACETFPRGVPPTVHRHGHGRPIKELDIRTNGKELRPLWQQPSLPEFDGYRVWNKIVDVYSRTHLTKSKDKLVAISALAKESRRTLKDDYLAGLWRRHLDWELGWDVEERGNQSRPRDYRCPSWSWASIDGAINTTNYGSNDHLLLKVLDAQITPLGDDDTGEIAYGFVRLQGPMYTLFLLPNNDMSEVGDRYDVFLSDKTASGEIWRKMNSIIDFDIAIGDATDLEERYYCLLHYSSDISVLPRFGKDEDHYVIALLLKYDDKNKNYSREGVLQLISFGPIQDSYAGGPPSSQSQCKATESPYRSLPGDTVQNRDRDGNEVNQTIWERLSARATRRLRDLELCHYDPDIPCEAYDDELGYTIKIV